MILGLAELKLQPSTCLAQLTTYVLGKGQPSGTTTAKGYYCFSEQQSATVVQCSVSFENNLFSGEKTGGAAPPRTPRYLIFVNNKATAVPKTRPRKT